MATNEHVKRPLQQPSRFLRLIEKFKVGVGAAGVTAVLAESVLATRAASSLLTPALSSYAPFLLAIVGFAVAALSYETDDRDET